MVWQEVGVVSGVQEVVKVAGGQGVWCSSPRQPLVSEEVSEGWGCGRGLWQGIGRKRSVVWALASAAQRMGIPTVIDIALLRVPPSFRGATGVTYSGGFRRR